MQRHSYTKVLDNRKHPIRGLWRRNDRYYARLNVPDDRGAKVVRWIPMLAASAAEAVAELRRRQTEREDNQLRVLGRKPTLTEYAATYTERLSVSDKRPRTVQKEKGCLSRWVKELGHLRLDHIRPSQVRDVVAQLQRENMKGRTCNIYLMALRNVLKSARIDGHIKALPTDGLPWLKSDTASRNLYSSAEIDRLCDAAARISKNGQELEDYARLMCYCGSRRDETLALRWEDVDFERRLLRIGADGQSKNRTARFVNFNPNLEGLLREMTSRRAPDSQWLFPSPQRGDRDEHAKTFMESLRLARTEAGLPKFGFHDCRHYFASMCVMSGIDFMSVARWLGHRDGGILVGRVYGHLASEHLEAQAARLSFGPTVVSPAKAGIA